jgi:hypothetical protein
MQFKDSMEQWWSDNNRKDLYHYCHSPQCSSEIKNELSYTSAPICLRGLDRDSLTSIVGSSFGPAERYNEMAALCQHTGLLLRDADRYIAFLNFNVSPYGQRRPSAVNHAAKLGLPFSCSCGNAHKRSLVSTQMP